MNCPNCDRLLSQTEKSEGRCRVCGEWFTTDRSPRSVLSWASVRTGLGQMIFGMLLVLVGTGLTLLVQLIQSQRERLSEGTGIELASVVGMGSFSIGVLLLLVGICLGCAAPDSSAAKGWAVGATICLFINILLVLALRGIEMEQRKSPVIDIGRGRPIDDFGRPAGSAPMSPVPAESKLGPGTIQIIGM